MAKNRSKASRGVVSVLMSLTRLSTGKPCVLKEGTQNLLKYHQEKIMKTQPKRKISITFSLVYKPDTEQHRLGIKSEDILYKFNEVLTLREVAPLAKSLYDGHIRPDFEERGLSDAIEDVLMRISYRV